MHHYWFHFSQNGTNAIEDFGLGKISIGPRTTLRRHSDQQGIASARRITTLLREQCKHKSFHNK
jgi:hypothetical protein